MRRLLEKKFVLMILAAALVLGLASAVLKAGSYVAERNSYIEVGGSDPVFVPRTATHVKIDGKVQKIAKFAALSKEEEDCRCPKCCDGTCYIIVWTNPASILGPIKILAIILIEC